MNTPCSVGDASSLRTIDVGVPFEAGTQFCEDPEDPIYPHSKYPECRFARDYSVPTGTPILAVLPGTVFLVCSHFSEHGFTPEFVPRANLVCIAHENGIYSEYIHLAFRGVLVQVGQQVRRGQRIGISGWSGLMNTPHLHLNLFCLDGDTPTSLPFRLQE